VSPAPTAPPALQQRSPPTPQDAGYTPRQALEYYAAGKHFDVVNGLTRIIDTGAIASDALKQLAPDYAEMKGVEPPSQPAAERAPAAEQADVSKLLADLDESVAYFEKEAMYETDNMGAGGSQIALGRWRRFIAAIWEARCFVAKHGPNWRALASQPAAEREDVIEGLRDAAERFEGSDPEMACVIGRAIAWLGGNRE
jgi:hypothetical protein